MAAPLKLISHKLCPYVQRAVIALTEKGVAVRADRYRSRQQAGLVPEDLAARQDAGACWSATRAIFESAVILEYLEETQPKPLHPADALRARRASRLDRVRLGRAQRHRRASTPRTDEADIQGQGGAARARSSRGWRRASSRRRGSTAKSSRWSMRCSARCSAISMCSTRSAISAFWPASRSSRAGASILRQRPSVRDRGRAPTIRRCCATSSTGVSSWLSQLQAQAQRGVIRVPRPSSPASQPCSCCARCRSWRRG